MKKYKRIFPECNADTLLVELLLERDKQIHYHGISKVAKALEELDNEILLVFGIVDSDKFKRNPPYLDKFTITKEDRSAKEGLILRQMPNSNKHIIFVCPKFENWIWKRAEEAGIDPKNYGIASLRELFDVSKSNKISESPEFKKFVNAVVRSNNAAIETLRGWLMQVFD